MPQAAAHLESVGEAWTQLPMPPDLVHRSCGRQVQLGVPWQAAGTSAQYGVGGVQGAGVQPPPEIDGQNDV